MDRNRGDTASARGLRGLYRTALAGTTVLLLAALGACSSGSGTSASGPSASGPSGQTASSPSGPSASGTGSGDTKQVTFALLNPLTGSNAAYGKFQVQGATMAIDKINSAGGIGGDTKVVLLTEDTQAVPEKTVTAFNHAYSQSHMSVAISVGSSSLLAITPLAKQNDVVLFNGGAQGDELAGQSNLFNTIPLYADELSALAPYLVNKAGHHKAAVLYTSDALGHAALNDFQKSFTAAGGQVVATASETQGSTDLRSQLSKLRAAKPDLLFLGTYGNDVKVAMDQTRQMGWDVPFAGSSLIAIPPVLSDKNAEGTTHALTEFNPPQDFITAFTAKYGSPPAHPFVGTYYDAVMVAAQAYQYARTHGYGTGGTGIARAVTEIPSFPSIFGGTITFHNGVAQRPISIAVMQGGRSVIMAK